MPLYSYVCKKCGHLFDEMHKMDDRKKPTEVPCTQCQETDVEISMGAPAICDPTRIGIRKPCQHFRKIMKGVQKANPKQKIKDYD